MSEVITRPVETKTQSAKAPSKAVAKVRQPTKSPDPIKVAFCIIQTLLDEASTTEEQHAWSTDSDRLLRMAHNIADEASVRTPSAQDAEELAFDIAALISASKLVPGDSESEKRRELLDQAAVQLNWLTKCDTVGINCIDPGAPRPPAPNAKSVPAHQPQARQQGTERARELANAAICHIEAAKTVLEMLTNDNAGDEVHAVARLTDALWEVHASTDETEDIGTSCAGAFSDLQRELSIVLSVADMVRQQEDGPMCAVAYLLEDASRLMEEALQAIPRQQAETSQ